MKKILTLMLMSFILLMGCENSSIESNDNDNFRVTEELSEGWYNNTWEKDYRHTYAYDIDNNNT